LPEGTIYPALHRLEQAGLLNSHWTTAESGRQRRVYSLTKRGTRALSDQRVVWQRFTDAIGGLLGQPGHAKAKPGR
jgi:PadR family transcriptional regulator, regulatory protein PadR